MKQFCRLILYIALSLSLGLTNAFADSAADKALWSKYNSAGKKALNRGDYPESLKQIEAALKVAEDLDEDLGEGIYLVFTLKDLGLWCDKQNRYEEAESHFKRSLAILERDYGPEDSTTGVLTFDLADFYNRRGRYVESESLYLRTIAILEKAGDGDPGYSKNLPNTLDALAGVYRELGRHEEAESLNKRAREIRKPTRN